MTEINGGGMVDAHRVGQMQWVQWWGVGMAGSGVGGDFDTPKPFTECAAFSTGP